MKILINGYYGCVGMRFFRYYNRDVAESVTVTGQYIIKKIANDVNSAIKQKLKIKKDPLIYIDTDSNYYSLQCFIDDYENKTGKKFKDDMEKVKFIDNVGKKVIQPVIDKAIQEIGNVLNVYKNTFKMPREEISKSFILLKKKKYIKYVKASEVTYFDDPKVKIKGVEIVRTSTPQVIRDELKKIVNLILHSNNEDEVRDEINDYKAKYNGLDITLIANPRGIKGLKKYSDGNGWYSDIVNENGRTIGCPVQVRASILYNHLLKKHGVENKYPPIMEGDKIKFIYLKLPNPLKEDVIGFPNGSELPKEFDLHKFIDYKTQFEKSFISPLDKITSAMGWDIKAAKLQLSLI